MAGYMDCEHAIGIRANGFRRSWELRTMSSTAFIPFDHMPAQPGIYRLVNAATGGFYIGMARNLYRRTQQHSDEIRRGAHDNPNIAAAVLLSGVEAFKFEVLEIVTKGGLRDRERYCIRKYDPPYNRIVLKKKAPRLKSSRIRLSVCCDKAFAERLDTFSSRDGMDRCRMLLCLASEAMEQREAMSV